jgi:hypothetical protein
VTGEAPAPYTVVRRESGAVFWYADIAAIARDPQGLGRLAVDGHKVVADGLALPGTLLSVAVHPKGHVPPFDGVAQARAAAQAAPWPEDVTEIDSGYVLLDGGETYYRATGKLDGLVVAPGPFEGLLTFVQGGVAHILTGADHLLFLVCLVLGASGVAALAWRITGFTVGHSITLAAGFYGLAPKPAWFEPGIEAAIAASIVLAAISTLSGRGGRGLVAVTLAIGLIHGFGFSFSLRDLLHSDGPNVLAGLAGFNIGVELGQLAVGLSVFALFLWLRRYAALERRLRASVTIAAMAVAMVWLVERVPDVWAAARL